MEIDDGGEKSGVEIDDEDDFWGYLFSKVRLNMHITKISDNYKFMINYE